jgi:hypothetical protein
MTFKALQLTRRRPGACEGYQPGGRVGWQERRPPAGVSSGFTGGAQLSAGPLDGAETRGQPEDHF